ncbi:DUF3883 domain-containing protein [Cyclobacterium roseum]|uniref:DUF3883 domain-containing protein n=1 Tax=Cyclobacterium roseum TaxID=2666137 RepID=UPI001390C7F1|nr:DUF3883 domain-containing protein [Cyclobacterium roseum]
MSAWSNIEVELIVADYFSMLKKELSGQEYKKSEHRKKLLPLLSSRSEGSIEFKHQNISAVLINLGQPYLKGYLPRYNYQMILEEIVIGYLKDHQSIEEQFKQFAEKEINQTSTKKNFKNLIVEAPSGINKFEEPSPAYTRNPIKINYLEKEQKNRNLGLLGEEMVIEYEKWQLTISGRENLADKVKWISKEEGDGTGFDILSKNPNGTDKYIEVKTTKLGKETPFFFSRNELQFSKQKSNDYYLYRLFNFEKDAKMFLKNGGLDTICTSVPITFKGYF